MLCYRQDGQKENNMSRAYEPYEALANAIVLQAVEDFKVAVYKDDRTEQRRIRMFFDSPLCRFLSNLNCDGLANKLRDSVLEFVRLKNIAINDSKAEGINKEAGKKLKKKDRDAFKNVFKCPTCGGNVEMTYGFVKSMGEKKNDTYSNVYGWIVTCMGCGFKTKDAREKIKCEKKVKQK